MIQFKYRPDVDGLRAIAVGMVLLYHTGLGLPGGFVGVDVFFVISGFLITSLIAKEQRSNTFTLAGFWARRIRRIIPAATLVSVACLVAGFLFFLPLEFEGLAGSLVAQQLTISNFYFLCNTDYFAGSTETMPLLHTWSLAVEEQFYFIFPVLFFGLKRFSNRTILAVFVVLAASSLALSEWALGAYPRAAFFMLPTRAWELLLGAILAYCPEPRRPAVALRELGAWAGLALMVVPAVTYSGETKFPGLAAAAPCLGTFLIIYCNSLRLTSLGAVLSNRALVFVGLISYSLYLWHWPLLAFLRYWLGVDLPISVRLVVIPLSCALAATSWKFVEIPFRQGLVGVHFGRALSGAVASAAVVASVSGWVYLHQGLPSRVPEYVRHIAEPIRAPRQLVASVGDVREGRLPVLGTARDGSHAPDFLVWGDSHALALNAVFDSLARQRGLTGVMAARSGTVPVLGVWRPYDRRRLGKGDVEWKDAVLEFIRASGVKNVILIARWAVYVDGMPNGEPTTLVAEANSSATDVAAARAAFAGGLRRTLDELEALGVRTWVLKQAPEQEVPPQPRLVRNAFLGWTPPRGVCRKDHHLRNGDVNNIVDAETTGRRLVRVVDPTERFFDEKGFCLVGDADGSYYRDADHLSEHGGVMLIRPLLTPVFDGLERGRGPIYTATRNDTDSVRVGRGAHAKGAPTGSL